MHEFFFDSNCPQTNLAILEKGFSVCLYDFIFKRMVSLGGAYIYPVDKMLQHWMVNPENLMLGLL